MIETSLLKEHKLGAIPEMAKPKRRSLRILQCPYCGTEFQAAHWRKTYCSKKCKERFYHQRNRTKLIARSRSWYAAQHQYVNADELEECRENPRKARTIAGPDVIVCLVCGVKLKELGDHVKKKHDMTVAEYKRKPALGGQAPRYSQRSSLTSTNLYRFRSKKWKSIGAGDRLAGHGQPIQRLNRSRGPWKRSLECRLNQSDAQKGKGRPDLWKKTPEGEVVTDAVIAKLRLTGMKGKDIAQHIGMKENDATYVRLHRMGFPPGVPCLFEYGEPIAGRHIRDLCSDFGMTKKEMAKKMRVNYSNLCESSRSDKPISVRFAKRVLKARQELAGQSRHQGAPSQGGSSYSISPSERASIYARYQRLSRDFEILQQWRKRQDGGVSKDSMWNWLCERSRDRTIRLLFWPEFLDWILGYTEDPWTLDVISAPQGLIQGFLADSHNVSERTIRRTLDNVHPEHQANIRQARPLLAEMISILAGAPAMFSKDLVKALKESDPAAWKDLTQIKLANELKAVGVEPRTVRLSGKKTLKGYYKADLERALRNSLPLK